MTLTVVYASDLHLEFASNRVDVPNVDGVDLVVLAGDIGVGLGGLAWAAQIEALAVVYVPGNHEFYGHDRPSLLARLRDAAAKFDHLHVLDNQTLDLRIDGQVWRVLGATLWTDFAGGPIGVEAAKRIVEHGLNDFRLIREGGDRFTTGDAVMLNAESRGFIERNLAAARADPGVAGTVVVTHHAPLMVEFTPMQFIGGPYNPGFCSNWPELFERHWIEAWIADHTHKADVDCTVAGCRILSRQLGYPGELWRPGSFEFGRVELRPKPRSGAL